MGKHLLLMVEVASSLREKKEHEKAIVMMAWWARARMHLETPRTFSDVTPVLVLKDQKP